MVLIPAGSFQPPSSTQNSNGVAVEAFFLDILPVTNGDFLEFVRANPRWRRSSVKRAAAEENYLKRWSGDLDLGDASPQAPVTHVSWFAAKAYALWKKKRLPTTAEWERAAAASPATPDGENDAVFTREVRLWYSTPAPVTPGAVGRGKPNFFGVHDLHGLLWEWVSDFNAPSNQSGGRGGAENPGERFCGGGANGARDPENFPMFMRYGFRSSLQPDYAVHNLGFRCARSISSER
jgi:sulfatase modifying factor 1